MKRYDLELTATGPVMEERKEGAFVPFAAVEPLRQRIHQLLEERNNTGIAISNAILVGVVPDKHPLRSRLELLANHHKHELMLAELLRRARRYVSPLSCPESEIQIVQSIVSSIDAVLAGKINFDLLMAAVHKIAPEGWQLVPVEPTTEMVEAYFAGKMEAQSCTHQQRARERVARDYRAMLAAAPKQQGGEPCDSASPSSSPD
ncbi:hypothetical protein [Aeromonas sp. QDB11]|uniref:hypothetical protein n=1 Tax=Aeromonas sp. QDB11 TaxID=2990482 RepID=UPI0022E283D0|nr:hypothetical protein [Aeromonas sp. QDB11]